MSSGWTQERRPPAGRAHPRLETLGAQRLDATSGVSISGNRHCQRRAVWRALAKFGAPVGDISPDEMAEPGTFFTGTFFSQGNPPFRVDIIIRISGVEFDDAWSRRLIHTVNAEGGLTAPFVCAEDLIENKAKRQGRKRDASRTLPTLLPCAARTAASQTKSSGYNTRLPPRFFAHIRDKLLQAHLRSGLNRAPRAE